MSEILDLAKRFEQKSKQQVMNIDETLKKEFEAHKSNLISKLRESEKSFRDATREHTKKMLKLLQIWTVTMLVAVLMSFLLLVAAAYLYLPIELLTAKSQRVQLMDGRSAIVLTGSGWTICTLNNRQLPCKTEE